MSSYKGQGFKAKRDTTEPAIVNALQQLGCLVERSDIVDLLVQHKGVQYLVECKTPITKAGKVTRTKKQEAMLSRGWRIYTLTSADDAIQFIQSISKRAA